MEFEPEVDVEGLHFMRNPFWCIFKSHLLPLLHFPISIFDKSAVSTYRNPTLCFSNTVLVVQLFCFKCSIAILRGIVRLRIAQFCIKFYEQLLQVSPPRESISVRRCLLFRCCRCFVGHPVLPFLHGH